LSNPAHYRGSISSDKAHSPVTSAHYRGSGSAGKAQDPSGSAHYQNTNLKVKKGPSL
jgi:hypothetical protein